MNSINEKIVFLRKKNGLTQDEVSEKLNVTRQAISKWENGYTKPDIDKLQELAIMFNVGVDYFLNNEKIKEQPKLIEKDKSVDLRYYFLIAVINMLGILFVLPFYFHRFGIGDTHSGVAGYLFTSNSTILILWRMYFYFFIFLAGWLIYHLFKKDDIKVYNIRKGIKFAFVMMLFIMVVIMFINSFSSPISDVPTFFG